MDRVVVPSMCRYVSVKYERMLANFAKKMNISKGTLKRVISSLVAMLASHLITLPIISYIMLINFMRENKILSYELINELYLSNKLFTLISVLFLVAFSMSLFSFIIPLCLYFIERKESNKKYNTGIKTIMATLAFNVVIFILLSISLKLKGRIDWEYTSLILITSLYITIHAIIHLIAKTSSKILLHGMLITFVSGMCIMPNSYASRLFSIGLQEFSVGGNIPATIYHQSARFGEDVKIILHTPKTLFFRKGDVAGLIPGDKINMIIYRKNTDDKEKARN
ncbi:hypothetical protein [Pectobacterium brasiliense]|uniref:hypothetical protein n=1 Tax=Pectobacterium brasiliense TaxID=180957 RepID=UPI0015DEFF0F|nr:hypothetical protein [Pectobacterium brasiliense]MBA0211904.1 hypothetical protein [Pectobacterium brasiliense]